MTKPTNGNMTVSQAIEIQDKVKIISNQDKGKLLLEMGISIAKSCTKTLIMKTSETTTSKTYLDIINGLYCGTRKNGKKLIVDFEKLSKQYTATYQQLNIRPMNNKKAINELKEDYKEKILMLYESLDGDSMDLIQNACLGIWENDTVKNGFKLCRRDIYRKQQEIPSEELCYDSLSFHYYPKLTEKQKENFSGIMAQLYPVLTKRERETLEMMLYIDGTNADVATALGVHNTTISTYMSHIRKKANDIFKNVDRISL